MVPPLELFLPFLPPLWAFVTFLPEAGFLPVSDLPEEPPVSCANAKLAPSNAVNANVRSFFMTQAYCGSINFPRNSALIPVHSQPIGWPGDGSAGLGTPISLGLSSKRLICAAA